jgi:ferritin-like metal-binding protein YciE
MKLFSANIEDLQGLYVLHLKKALDMEQRIIRALPDLIERTTDPELAEAFNTHLEETKGHATKVESLLRSIVGEAGTETCKVMDGLTTAASDLITDVKDVAVRDIALIGAAQHVEHHEIAVYGTLRRWAELLGLDHDASILESIEAEEINADEILTDISERVNLIAAA